MHRLRPAIGAPEASLPAHCLENYIFVVALGPAGETDGHVRTHDQLCLAAA